jgi:anti-anti-sigma factor
MNTLSVSVFDLPQAKVIRLEGHAGYRSGELLEEPLRKILAAKPPLVVFDLTRLEFVASLFLRQMVMFRRDIRESDGHVQLAGLQPQVLDVLRSSGLEELFEIIPEAPVVSA